MKRNKLEVLTIVILSLIIFVISAFIIWDKELMKDKTNNNEINDSLDNNQNDSNKITSISQYPKENSSDVLLAGEVFSDLLSKEQQKLVNSNIDFDVKLSVNEIEISYNCIDFNEGDNEEAISWCETSYINFPSNRTLRLEHSLGCGTSDNIIYTNDYLLHQRIYGCSGYGYIEIYDKYGNLVLTIENVINNYTDNDGKIKYNDFKYVDGYLYYLTCVDEKLVSFNYLDLRDYTKIEIHNIETFEDKNVIAWGNIAS